MGGDVEIGITNHRCDSEINTYTAIPLNRLDAKGGDEFSGTFYLMQVGKQININLRTYI